MSGIDKNITERMNKEMAYQNVFSNFEIKNASIKFKDAEAYVKLGCVGSAEDELEVKEVLYQRQIPKESSCPSWLKDVIR